VGLLVIDFASIGPYLSFLATQHCAVPPDDQLPQGDGTVRPFGTRGEARSHRADIVRGQAFFLGVNVVTSGLLLLAVHDRGSRAVVGLSAAFPLVFSLARYRNFSPERESDRSLPIDPEVRLEAIPDVVPEGGQSRRLGLTMRMQF
jgi:hypothetical protein